MSWRSTSTSAFTSRNRLATTSPLMPAPTMTMRGLLLVVFWTIVCTRLFLLRLERLNQCRNNLEQVADDSVVRHLEDGGVWVAIDRDNGFRASDPNKVLRRAGNPDRQVQLRTHGMARGTNL